MESVGDLEALSRHAIAPESFAELHWLLHLGWTLHQDASVTELTVAGGKPLIHPTIEAAKEMVDRSRFAARGTTQPPWLPPKTPIRSPRMCGAPWRA